MDDDDFFVGVDAVRAHLDRHLQGTDQRRERLARIAKSMPGRMNQVDFADWFIESIATAVGAHAASVERGARVVVATGESSHAEIQVDLLEVDSILRLRGIEELDPPTERLLCALCETAVAVLTE